MPRFLKYKFKYFTKLFTTSSRGFTLVEVLISIFIFSLAFTATSFVLTTNMRSASFVGDSFVASGLAQEGLEVVRNIRDRDWFLGNSFGTSIPNGTYRVQWNSESLIALGLNPSLKLDSTNGLFSYDSGPDTIFKRTVTITTVSANIEKRVIVTVSWNERGGAVKTLSAESHLFNWR
ncbi:MAG TPA: prepilin-type N-terminal cleavage/methylation domain-containing protein [Candidatus Paceibacterota bacterium]